MKKTILALMLIISMYCQAQTMEYRSTLEYKFPDSVLTGFSFNTISAKMKKDTIPVIMLISDTAHNFITYLKFRHCEDSLKNNFRLCGEQIKEDQGNNGVGQAFWMNGYCVSGFGEWKSNYLDNKKCPVNPTIIVWMSLSVK